MKPKKPGFTTFFSVFSLSTSLIFFQSLILTISAYIESSSNSLLPLVLMTVLLPPSLCLYFWLNSMGYLSSKTTNLFLRLYFCFKIAYLIILLEYYLVLTIFSSPTNRILVGVFFQINLTISVAEQRKMRLLEQLIFFGVLHLYLIFRLSPSLSCLLAIVANFLHLVLISFQLRKEAICH